VPPPAAGHVLAAGGRMPPAGGGALATGGRMQSVAGPRPTGYDRWQKETAAELQQDGMIEVSESAVRAPETGGPPPGPQKVGGAGVIGSAVRGFLQQREASVVLIAVVLVIYFSTTTTGFTSHGSVVNIAQYLAPYAIIAIGEVFLMVSGEIDLSIGYIWMFSPFVMHWMIDSGVQTILAIVLTVLLMSLIGLANGLITTLLGVPSLITTLAVGWIVYGYALTVSSAQQVNLPPQSTRWAGWFGAGNWSEFIWATVLIAIFHVVFVRTRWGLYTVSVGGNLLGAREAGIRVNGIKTGNFMISAAMGGLAGILEAFQHTIIDPSAGQLAVVLVALAGVVIGGTAMAGGSGTVIGAWLGVLVLGILEDGFNLRGISSNNFQMILGGAILIMMIANNYLVKLRTSGRLVKS
jgi:simple sugar transport system permease protein